MIPEERQESDTLTDSPGPQARAWKGPGFNWFDARGFSVLGWTLTSGYVLLQVFAGLARRLGAFDDCIPLISAVLINSGRKPIVDFNYIYPPLFDYLYAIPFRMLGRAAIVPRIFSSILYIAVTIQTARFLRRRAPLFRPLGPLMTLLAAVSLVSVSLLPVWPAYAFSLLAVFSYPGENSDSQPTNRRLFLCGLLAGASMLLRLNFGLYAAAALAAYTCLLVWASNLPQPRKRFRTVTLVASIMLGATLPSALFYCSVYGADAWTAVATMLDSTHAALPGRFYALPPIETAKLLLFPFFWWVVPVIVDTNRLCIESLLAGVAGVALSLISMAERRSLLLPFIIPALTFSVFTVLSLWRKRLSPTHLIFVLFYATVLHYYLSRADDPHAMPLLALQGLMFILLVVPGKSQLAGNQMRMSQRGAAFATLLAGLWVFGNYPESIPARDAIVRGANLAADWIKNPKISDSDRIQGQLTGEWQAIFSPPEGQFAAGELNAIKYVASQTRPFDPIFVGAQDNSRIYASDIRIYWLTGRLPGSRYYELDAGVASTLVVQERIIRDLERNGVNWVILMDEEGWGDPSFLARVHAESMRLDDFFRGKFREVERFGRFSILKRR